MSKRFIITGLLTSVVNLAMHAMAYAFVLKDFFYNHPAISREFSQQFVRQPDQLIVWAMVATSLMMGFLITIIMKWSCAKTFAAGLKYAFITGFLFWGSVNFGLHASSNFFSQASVFVDLFFSTISMTIAGAFAAWMLGKESKKKETTKE